MADIPQLSHDLNRTLENCGLSPDGAKYVKMAIDPFHDAQLEVVGLPDAHGGRTLVYDVKKNLTIDNLSSGGTLTPGAAWDCHINFTPALFRRPNGGADNLIKYTSDINERHGPDFPAGAGGHFGNDLLRISRSTTAAGTTFVPATPLTGSHLGVESIGILDVIGQTYGAFEGAYRVIGFAYEIHNTTANLHKQGAVTCYRNNIAAEQCGISWADNPFTGCQLQPTTVIQGPPTTVEQAKLIGGVTYAAREGALIPCPLNPSHCKPRKFSSMPLAVYSNEEGVNHTLWAPTSMKDMGGAPQACPQANACLVQDEFMQTGAYFTGLSEETTLELTMRAFVEFFPSARSPLFSLGRPSPSDDPLVDKCLAEISTALLPGYPVSMNAKGDFFKAVLGAAKKVAKVGKTALGVGALFSPRLAAANQVLNNGLVEARDVKRAVKKDIARAKTVARNGGKR